MSEVTVVKVAICADCGNAIGIEGYYQNNHWRDYCLKGARKYALFVPVVVPVTGT